MMSLDRLRNAYDPELFKKQGYALIDQLSAHLNTNLEDPKAKTLFWNTPDEEAVYWKAFMDDSVNDDFFETLIARSIHIHNPKYIGHQVNPTLPITALTAMVTSLLNNGMGVYEMGVAATAIEKVIADWLCNTIGFPDTSGGFLTSGGTLANVTALLTARQHFDDHIWTKGLQDKRLAIMVSEQAHYCVDRAARIMGLGAEGIIKVPVNSEYTIDTSQLEACYQDAQSKGLSVFALVGSAPSTATGMYDDLEFLARFAQKHQLWYHIDAAHGGAAICSPKYKHLLNGIQQADSVVIDGHKMFMIPALNTALLFKDLSHSYETFSQKADYLLTHSKEDWYNLAKRTFECTKYMMSVQWMSIIKHHGTAIFDDYVSTLFDLGQAFYQLLEADEAFEIAVQPHSNILCFRWTAPELSEDTINERNLHIRKTLLEAGDYYIVKTVLQDTVYLRVTIMNPFTDTSHFKGLISTIKSVATNVIS